VAYAVAEGLDHLTLAPCLVARGIPLRAFVAFFAYAFIALWGAYLANDPKSRRGVGIGAFNLVRRAAYERIGTMRPLSLRPDDDIRLGRRLRAFGFRQRVLNGNELLSGSAACFAWAIVRSVYLAETRGVRWRGTTYPLSLLRAQSGLEGIAANRNR